jgi:rRNA maturation endonuclease Nob1
MGMLDGHDTMALLKIDKSITVDYGGFNETFNRYVCNNCRQSYVIEECRHKFCPFCGTQYTLEIDVSVKAGNKI